MVSYNCTIESSAIVCNCYKYLNCYVYIYTLALSIDESVVFITLKTGFRSSIVIGISTFVTVVQMCITICSSHAFVLVLSTNKYKLRTWQDYI